MKKVYMALVLAGLTACGSQPDAERSIEPMPRPDSGRIIINDSMPHHEDEDSIILDSTGNIKTNP